MYRTVSVCTSEEASGAPKQVTTVSRPSANLNGQGCQHLCHQLPFMVTCPQRAAILTIAGDASLITMALVVPPPQPHSRAADPTAPLTQALQSFEHILMEEQKQQYRASCKKPDASSVIRFVAQIDANSRSRASRCVAPRLCTFLDATQQFAGIVDTFANSNPAIAALVWGGVKTAILTASNISSYFDKVTSMIMAIGKFCPTYQQFGQLYPGCSGLQEALCQYYAITIRLCITIVEVSRRTAVGQILAAIFNPYESEFQGYHDELDQAAKNVQLHISLASKQVENETVRLLELDRKENALRRRSARLFQKDARNEHAEARQWRIRKAAREAVEMRSAIRANLSTINHVKPWQQAMKQLTPKRPTGFSKTPPFVTGMAIKRQPFFGMLVIWAWERRCLCLTRYHILQHKIPRMLFPISVDPIMKSH